MTRTYKRSILTAPREVVVEEVPIPTPGPGQALVQVKACAICTWEQRVYSGVESTLYPLLGGHEVSGVLAEVGPGVQIKAKPGDHVIVSRLHRCFQCASCRRGLDSNCDNSWSQRQPGVPMGPGGLAEYVLADGYQIFTTVGDVPFVESCLSEPLSCVLRSIVKSGVEPGDNVVIIGAGNVGCDAATEAHRQGAKDITLIDIQEPASFGKERAAAEKAGARFLWPVSVSAITTEGVELADGKILPCDTVVVAIGDRPDISFLPTGIDIRGGFIVVDDAYRTSDPQVYAIGDSVKPGLLTDAIGAGRTVSRDIDARLKGLDEPFDRLPPMNTESVKLQYYDPGRRPGEDIVECSTLCASCGGCRDCGLCETVCPRQAVSRRDLQRGGYEYRVDGDLCIGCGFCAGACPCGIWEMKENEPLD